MSDIITAAAVRAIDDVLFGPMPDALRDVEIRDALTAALPHLEPVIRERVFDELIAAAGEQRVVMPHENQGYPDTSDNRNEDMGALADWLRTYLPNPPLLVLSYPVTPYGLEQVESQLLAPLHAEIAAFQAKIGRLQETIRDFDDGENSDTAIEIMCFSTLRKGDMSHD